MFIIENSKAQLKIFSSRKNKDKLTQILTYHVIPGKVMSTDVMGAVTNAVSVQGEELTVDGTDGVTVNGATVTQADIETSNGVIHVIDAVILHILAT